MKIEISARRGELDESVRSYALERLERLARRFDGLLRCDLVLDAEGDDRLAELRVHAPRKADLTARGRDRDQHAAIDFATDKMDRQLKKLKSRILTRRSTRTGDAMARTEAEPTDEDGMPSYEDVVEEGSL